jgi:UDP-2,3-diacylglucosamine hydrolase
VSLFVVSDLHIRGSDDPVYRSLLTLLRERAKAGDTFVLAGDVFDLFIGAKSVYIERYRSFFDELRRAGERGVDLHYIEGNHDFLLRRAFEGIPRFKLHTRDFTLEMGEKRFFLAHGDLANRADYLYRALRVFLRSPFIRFLAWAFPGQWVDAIGGWSSKTSRSAKPELPRALPIQKMESLRKIYRSFAAERLAEGFDFVVMGHCHDLDEMSFQIGGRSGQYVNVGYPRVHGSYLSWSPGEDKIQRERMPQA